MLNEQQLLEVKKYFQCEADEIEHIEDDTYIVCRDEYIICDDERADRLTADYIHDSLWAFNASFICNFIDGLDELQCEEGMEAVIKIFQEQKCESANPVILRLVGNNLEALIQDAIMADGRGHFLSSYDCEEVEITGDLYAYRR